jgi:ATP-dependent Clp protease ATP-binding subunit ClpC
MVLNQKDIELSFSPEVKALILKRGFDERLGARPLKRAIQNLVTDKLAEEFLKSGVSYAPGCCLEARLVDGAVVFVDLDQEGGPGDSTSPRARQSSSRQLATNS